MTRRILFIIVAFFSAMPLYAAHLKGGYVEYENLGPAPNDPSSTRFRITVFQYLDCNSAGGQIDTEVNLGFYDLDAGAMAATAIIPITGTSIAQKKEFKCIDFPPNICYRIDSYETIQNLRNNSNGYLLTVQRCCRISGINNISNSVNAGVTYTVKLYTDPVNGGFLKNASPVFAREDTALVCANSSFTLPFKATDPDKDSLVFTFTPGLNTPSREAKPLPPLNPPFPDLIYSGLFSPEYPMGDKVSIDSRTGIISGIAPSAVGDYVVAVLVEEYRAGKKISEIRKEIHVSVANCTSPRAVLPQPGPVNCDTYDVKFTNLSNSPGITSYYWDFGVPGISNDTSTIASPTYVYKDTGVYQVKLVTNRNGLCSDSAFTIARVFPGFEPKFSYLGVCNLLPYQFSDQTKTSYGTVNSWRWDFGEPSRTDDSSRIKNPSYLFAASGTYNVSLQVASSKGCEGTITIPVQVSDKPVVQLAFRDTLICNKDTLQLRALIPGNYSWTPAYNIINANTATPQVYPKRTTTYAVLMDNNGCKATDSVRVNVVDFVTLEAGADTTICLTDQIQLQTVSNGNSFTWSPAASIEDPKVKNPKIKPTAVQTVYQVTAFLGNCQASDQVTVNTLPYPTVNAGPDTTICFGERVFLHGTSNADFVIWTPQTVVANSNRLVTTATPTSTGNLILTARNSSGCTNPIVDSVLITVLPRIIVDAGPDTSLVVNQPLQLSGNSSINTIQWSPAIGLNSTSILNPILTISPDMAMDLSNPLTYTLTATNAAGCSVSSEVVIKFFITGPTIFMPSGFTPNGDGKNDVIKPILAGMKELRFFRIFNRYGQLIFETKQIGRGWDGRINGELQPTSTFVYDCEAIDYLEKPARQRGTFVLIR